MDSVGYRHPEISAAKQSHLQAKKTFIETNQPNKPFQINAVILFATGQFKNISFNIEEHTV